MTFWDASAIVPLLLEEPGADAPVPAIDQPICVWWGTLVEAASAIARRERAGKLKPRQAAQCLARLAELAESWMEVAPTDQLRDSAVRLLRVHALSAADSLQLAAALAVVAGHAGPVEFICLDSRLSQAASREGFLVTLA